MKALIATAVAAMIATSASASFVNTYSSGPGLAVAIPDDGYNGTLGSMASNSINVGTIGADTIDAAVIVQIGMAHTWVGDLTIKLKAPDGTVITLLDRPGLVGPDDGSGCCGDSSNLAIQFAITYDDLAAAAAETLGSTLPGTNDVIGDPGNGSPSSYNTGGALTSLIGKNTVGAWTLYIGDSAGSDTGSIDNWSITLSTVPGPGALALLGLAGLASRRRRA